MIKTVTENLWTPKPIELFCAVYFGDRNAGGGLCRCAAVIVCSAELRWAGARVEAN